MEAPISETPVLRAHQVPHVERIVEILRREFGCLDTSGTGCGKTFTALEVSRRFRFDVMVVCPRAAISVWRTTAAKFHTTLTQAHCITFSALAGKKGASYSNGVLNRRDNDGEVSYHPNQLLCDWLKEGRKLVIVDEVQNCKNISCRTAAVVALAHAVYTCSNPTSRVLCLSAAPTDRREARNLMNLFRILGVVKEPNLYNYDHSSGVYQSTGLAELLKVAKGIAGEEEVAKFEEGIVLNKSTAGGLAVEIYHNWIKKAITVAMPSLNEIKRAEGLDPPDAKDGFYNILDAKDRAIYAKGCEKIRSVLSKSGEGYALSGTESLTTFTKGMKLIEEGMVPTMARVARKYLETYPNYKVALYVEYVGNEEEPGSVLRLMELLKDYNPLVLRSDRNLALVPHEEGLSPDPRTRTINAFQDRNSGRRLLITGATCGGVSISLDAQNKEDNRAVLILPSTKFMDQLQSVGRFWRAMTASTPTIRFMYAKGGNEEEIPDILRCLANKSNNAKDFIANPGEVLFPGEYPREYEE